MLGLVFTSLVNMVESKYSYEFAAKVLDDADLSTQGAYTSVGYYSFSELLSIIKVLSRKVQIPLNELLTAFGEHLMRDIASGHPHLLEHYRDLFDLLEKLDKEIHVTVKKLYSNASLPRFKVAFSNQRTMDLLYHSERRLEHLALGLLNEASRMFDEAITTELLPSDDDKFDVLIRIKKTNKVA
ncbi:heme NO-binding domain-containing protein [Ningiella sp. W23]|uniref:heme NO-binding domain-containing protein n=1 Tax=Ningiella sp. W23 TaxID=3023715 RepID=UPI0037568C0E